MMTKRSIKHATFVIERIYNTSPARVFSAWANSEAKARWFPKPDEFDFRIGGRELNYSTHEGARYTYDAHYQDIVPEQRIAYTYIRQGPGPHDRQRLCLLCQGHYTILEGEGIIGIGG